MLAVLANRTYRQLFLAQVVALVGTGLATIALALLAFQLAGDKAGAVLGTALFIKMLAYVGISPMAGALADRVPRKALLIAMDLTRASVVMLLPFVTEIWQVYVLIFLLQSASALFTPTFQAAIPDILPEERDYTRALSLSRLAYDLENLLSPTLATLLLLLISFHWLFALTAIGFLVSALLVLITALPVHAAGGKQKSFARRVTDGLRIFLATPRLRGLLALNLTAAAAGAMVIVNTVVIVGSLMGRPESDLGIAMGAFGAGSMLAALLLPRLLDNSGDRPVMIAGALALGLLLAVFAGVIQFTGLSGLWPWLLLFWALMGIAYASVLTPSGRLLKRSAHPADRPAVFAAQFALSHACWLVTYPLAGWLGAMVGMTTTLLVLSGLTLAGSLLALRFWPHEDVVELEHRHDDLPDDHPHWHQGHGASGGHKHVYVIDDLHPSWPQTAINGGATAR